MAVYNDILYTLNAADSACLILMADAPEFTVAEVTERYSSLSGKEAKELKGKGLFEIIRYPPRQEAFHREALQQVIQTGKRSSLKKDFVPEGQKALPDYCPVFDKKGHLRCILQITKAVNKNQQEDNCSFQGIENSEIADISEKYELILKATSDTIWDWNFQNNQIRWSRGIDEVFGYKDPGQTPFDWWVANVHPDDKERTLGSLERNIKKGISRWQEEYRLRCSDGTYKVVSDRGFLMFDQHGKPVRMIGVIHDITEKKQKEKELRESLALYKLISQASHDAIYDWDLESGKVSWSHAIGPVFGYRAGDEVSRERWWADKIHPGDFEHANKLFHAAIARRSSSLKREYRFRCHDGSYKYIDDECSIIYQSEKAVRILGTIKDVDELKRAHDEKSKLAELLSKVPSIVLVTDSDGIITWANKAFTLHSGYKRKEVLGRKPFEILHGPETDQAVSAEMKQIFGELRPFTRELINYSKTGTKYWIEINCTPIFNKDGVFAGYITIANEISVRKEREAYIEKQTSILRHIAWISSHEIRKPAANIIALLGLLGTCNSRNEKNELLYLLRQSILELDEIVKKITSKINSYEIDLKISSRSDLSDDL